MRWCMGSPSLGSPPVLHRRGNQEATGRPCKIDQHITQRALPARDEALYRLVDAGDAEDEEEKAEKVP